MYSQNVGLMFMTNAYWQLCKKQANAKCTRAIQIKKIKAWKDALFRWETNF